MFEWSLMNNDLLEFVHWLVFLVELADLGCRPCLRTLVVLHSHIHRVFCCHRDKICHQHRICWKKRHISIKLFKLIKCKNQIYIL